MTIKFDIDHDLERWGVRIYWIVTGVTSDVGVPLTRLVNNILALIQIMAWHQIGDKPLSEAMMG